jgi:Holliday junction resolvasome RuvABC ATP-dependent DNA helicase subunit
MSTSFGDASHRPVSFENFVGQMHIKQKLQTAIIAAQRDGRALGHVLFM